MADRRNPRSALAKRLGANLASQRRNGNWTQAKVAERVGVDTETISRFERGAALPSLLTLDKLARVLRVPLADLLTESSTEPDDQALAVSAWLDDLKEADRIVVLDVTKRLCQHLRPSKRR